MLLLHDNSSTLRGLTVSFCGLYIVVSRNHSVQNSPWGERVYSQPKVYVLCNNFANNLQCPQLFLSMKSNEEQLGVTKTSWSPLKTILLLISAFSKHTLFKTG